jgi:hypothetical protein
VALGVVRRDVRLVQVASTPRRPLRPHAARVPTASTRQPPPRPTAQGVPLAAINLDWAVRPVRVRRVAQASTTVALGVVRRDVRLVQVASSPHRLWPPHAARVPTASTRYPPRRPCAPCA